MFTKPESLGELKVHWSSAHYNCDSKSDSGHNYLAAGAHHHSEAHTCICTYRQR